MTFTGLYNCPLNYYIKVEYIKHWHWPFFCPQSLCCEIKQRRQGVGSVLRLCQHLLDDQETCNLNADHQSMQLIIVNLERRWEAIVMQAVQWQSRLQKKLSKDSVSDICLTFFSSPSRPCGSTPPNNVYKILSTYFWCLHWRCYCSQIIRFLNLSFKTYNGPVNRISWLMGSANTLEFYVFNAQILILFREWM